jgi:hypothetical protein
MEITNAVMAKKHRSGKPPEHRDVQLRAERWDALAPDQRSRLPNNHTLEVVPRDIYGDCDVEAGSFLFEAGMKQIDNTDVPIPTQGEM